MCVKTVKSVESVCGLGLFSKAVHGAWRHGCARTVYRAWRASDGRAARAGGRGGRHPWHKDDDKRTRKEGPDGRTNMAAWQLLWSALGGRVDEVRRLLDQGVHPDEYRSEVGAAPPPGAVPRALLCGVVG